MGNNCSNIQTTVTRNVCSASINDQVTSSNVGIPTSNTTTVLGGFCTYGGSSGNSYRQDWCSRVGHGNSEWKASGTGNSCGYNNCAPYQAETKSGCCHGCCQSDGKGAVCQRVAFKGDAAQCCLNDFKGCGLNAGTFSPGQDNTAKYVDLCFSNSQIGQAPSYANCLNTSQSSAGDCSRTCNPCQRDISANSTIVTPDKCDTSGKFGNYCSSVLTEYCAGGDLPEGDSSWINRWVNDDGTPVRYGCLNALMRNVYAPPLNDPINYNSKLPIQCNLVSNYFKTIAASTSCTPMSMDGTSPEGLTVASAMLAAVSARYKADGFVLGSLPGMPGYNPFQDFLYADVCCPFPLLCKSLLTNTCGQYSSQQMTDNPSIANWCGCYLPDGEYEKWTKTYQTSKQCTPLCNRTTAVPLVDLNNQPMRCNQDICIIDDTSIQLANTTVNGSVNVTQMCGNCHSGINQSSPSSCQCLIDSNSTIISGGQVNNVNVKEQCTTSSCTGVDPNTGQTMTLPCDQVGNEQQYIEQQQAAILAAKQAAQRQRNVNILILISVAIVIVIIAGFIIRPNLDNVEAGTSTSGTTGPVGAGAAGAAGTRPPPGASGFGFAKDSTAGVESSDRISNFGFGVGSESTDRLSGNYFSGIGGGSGEAEGASGTFSSAFF